MIRKRTILLHGILLFSALLLSSSCAVEARADTVCDDTALTSEMAEVRVTSLSYKTLDQALQQLEWHQACGELDLVSAALDQERSHRRDLRVAVLMVETLARGPLDMDDTRAQSAVKLMAFEVARLRPEEQEVLLAYAARKLAQNEESESLLAMVRGSVPHHIEVAIMANTATQPVARGPWEPPGGQAIPFYIGNRAHEAIAEYYRNLHSNDRIYTNSIPISAMLIQLAKQGVGPAENARARAKGDQALRPDIVNLTRREIYEIKPAGAEAEARALVARHVDTFARAGVNMKPGSTVTKGVDGVVSAPAGHFVFYAAEPGVIVYRYQRGDYVPVRASEEATATAHALSPAPAETASSPAKKKGFWARMEAATGLTGAALGVYLVFSEGSRIVFPPRNLVPVP